MWPTMVNINENFVTKAFLNKVLNKTLFTNHLQIFFTFVTRQKKILKMCKVKIH